MIEIIKIQLWKDGELQDLRDCSIYVDDETECSNLRNRLMLHYNTEVYFITKQRATQYDYACFT